jgi:hypothetical protein
MGAALFRLLISRSRGGRFTSGVRNLVSDDEAGCQCGRDQGAPKPFRGNNHRPSDAIVLAFLVVVEGGPAVFLSVALLDFFLVGLAVVVEL